MATTKTQMNRRLFLKSSTLAGGGMLLGFSWMISCKDQAKKVGMEMPEDWIEVNGYIKIGENGMVTIMSPNPEGGQNVKTSMPMIVADELDADWDMVVVEQAPLDTDRYTRQFIGGSQAIRQSWERLRQAGASAKYMLMQAAAETWGVPMAEIMAEKGQLTHSASGKKGHYGEFATAASKLSVPETVSLKDIEDFTIIGTSKKNVDTKKIITGKPLFGMDHMQEGMLTAMIVHPPAFGLTLKSFDASSVKGMPGIKDVFSITTYADDYEWQYFDTNSFLELVVVVGDSTWEVMNAKKALTPNIEWETRPELKIARDRFGSKTTMVYPAGLENTSDHNKKMLEMSNQKGNERRKDGDPDRALREADQVLERSYTAPFLAHNCMEPMNFFAHVTEEKADFAGPLQKPEFTEKTLSSRLDIPLDKIDIKMTRLGGGYGRRSYAHWLVEAGIVSKRMNAPVKLMYTREDDMTAGIYRPAYRATYKAALDGDKNITGLHLNAGGVPESPMYADRFPAGTLDNYSAEDWAIPSNITVGSFRAPRSNFMACAEQTFLDELAETMGKDPIELRLELLSRAETDPVGERNDYDPARYKGVLELVRDKSNWGEEKPGVSRGVAAYFCHNSYVAQVLDLIMEDGQPKVDKVYCAVDCGIVVNPDAAKNLLEGAVVDGIGNAMFGSLSIKDGKPNKQNFDDYRMIRMSEAPKEIEVHFVENQIDPTGLGEPAFPPIFPALANAMYKATGKRLYDQPFL
ncbi:MAG: molybdopterin cofactor-binding domain-containing protein [Bacteroidota bacterium]|nr:molybdopterin cofactor-binding domain-containing protein [Bacteroidota bacterium]